MREPDGYGRTGMSIYAQLSISRDGYLAGPDPSLDEPLGRGGMQLHDWVFGLAAWRREHGMEGGEEGPESAWVEEVAARTGAYVMGRRMFSGGAGSGTTTRWRAAGGGTSRRSTNPSTS